MILTIGNRATLKVASFNEASRLYARYRDASLFPDGRILDGTRIIARVSYNGKVWPPAPCREDQEPLFDPHAEPDATSGAYASTHPGPATTASRWRATSRAPAMPAASRAS